MHEKVGQIIEYSKKLVVLYAEDNKGARESTKLILDEFFDHIILAVDGQDGFDKFNQYMDEIDLVITDINMPHMNGLDLSEKIKK